MGHFFFIVTLVALFLLHHQKIFVPYIVLYTVRLSLLHNETVFSPSKYIGYKCYICFIPGMGHFFFIVTFVYTCHAFFLLYHQKYLSHVLFWSQPVSVCFAMKSFFSFKIHCLQMIQLFQTKDGPIFFIVKLVYTCRAFLFCSIIRKYLSRVLFWSQLVSVCFAMKLFFSFKIYSLQMFQLFQTRDGPFFSSSHLSRFFCSIIRKYLSNLLFWSRPVSVCFAMKFFFSFKIHCLQMFQLFQTRDGPFYFIVTPVYTCRAFFALS